jgi:hypothetical protein
MAPIQTSKTSLTRLIRAMREIPPGGRNGRRISVILEETAGLLATKIFHISQEESAMADTIKKASAKPKAPAKTRKTATQNGAENGTPSHVTEIKFSHEQVAQLAHKYWAERGQQDGHHLEDWFRAEQELRARAS